MNLLKYFPFSALGFLVSGSLIILVPFHVMAEKGSLVVVSPSLCSLSGSKVLIEKTANVEQFLVGAVTQTYNVDKNQNGFIFSGTRNGKAETLLINFEWMSVDSDNNQTVSTLRYETAAPFAVLQTMEATVTTVESLPDTMLVTISTTNVEKKKTSVTFKCPVQ